MANIIVTIIILTVVIGAIAKIVSAKRNGARCVGCSSGHTGGSNCGCNGSK